MSVDEVSARHQARDEDTPYRRIELITGGRRRRAWTPEEKDLIVAASAEPTANISEVARRFGVHRGLLGVWRRQAGLVSPRLPPTNCVTDFFVPVTVEGATERAVVGGDGPPQPNAAGYIEIEVDGARLVVRGAVEPALAGAIIAALRGQR